MHINNNKKKTLNLPINKYFTNHLKIYIIKSSELITINTDMNKNILFIYTKSQTVK